MLSDVYMTVWKRAGAYEPGRASPISWLATIARNRAIDWRRSARRVPSAPLDEAPDIADVTPSSVERMLLDEREAQLYLCLEELQQRQRTAIRTAFFDGLTYAELAARQGVPLGTMKSWVRRGLLRLRECLGADD